MMNSLSNIKIRNKLVLMIFFPVVGLLLLSANELYNKYRMLSEMKSLQALSTLAIKISPMIHELQRERGMTAVFVGSKGMKLESELPAQRSNTDKRIVEFHAFIGDFDINRFGAEFKGDVDEALSNLKMLREEREYASRLKIKPEEIIDYYTRTNTSFLDIITHISKLSADTDTSTMVAAYVNFLRGKESTGIERATLSDAFAGDKFVPGIFNKFISTLRAQEIYMDAFLSYAAPDQRAFYKNKMKGEFVDEVVRMRKIALEKGNWGKFGVDSPYWYKMITGKIDLLKDVEDKLSGDLEVVTNRLKSTAQFELAMVMFILTVIVFISFTLAYYISSGITRSLNEAVGVANRLAKGDMTAEVKVSSGDEPGLLLSAMGDMIAKLKVVILQTLDASTKVFSTATALEKSSECIQVSSQTQFQTIEEVSTSIEEMDSSVRSVAENANRLSQSLGSASASSSEMFATITEVAENTERLASSVDTTVSSINEMAVALEQVAQCVSTLFMETENIVSTVTAMNSSIKEVSLYSMDQANMAEKVKEDALTIGMEAVKKTREGMKEIRDEVSTTAGIIDRLGERSKEIGNITDIIDEIAVTTNLLALNAAILAAQAGEHGRGFSVVAEEIKGLAERTTASTKEITVLIGQVQGEVKSAVGSMELSLSRVEDGVILSRNAEEALKKITESAEASLKMAKEIESASAGQTKGVTQTVEAIQRINLMVKEIKRATEEQGKAAADISRSIEEIRGATWSVKEAMNEQSRGSKIVSEIILAVTQKMHDISKVTSGQKKAFETITASAEVMKRETEKSVLLAAQLDMEVSNLHTEGSSLKKKVENFIV